MRLRLGKGGGVAFASFAWLAGCGLFGPKETAATDAGAARTAPSGSATPVVTGLSFVGSEPFEGEITMTLTRPGRPPALRFVDVKGARARMRTQPSTGDTYVLVNTSTWKIDSVSDPDRRVTVSNLGGMFPGVMRSTAVPVRTGEVRAVAGYVCDVYRADVDGGDRGEACMAKGLRFPALDPMLADLGGDSFPLRVVVRDATGQEKSHIEVTRVEKVELPDSLFLVPSGYETVDMGALVNGRDAH
jgi:hypothetical protein